MGIILEEKICIKEKCSRWEDDSCDLGYKGSCPQPPNNIGESILQKEKSDILDKVVEIIENICFIDKGRFGVIVNKDELVQEINKLREVEK